MWIPVVDVLVCRGCGDCVQVCPDAAITIADKKARIDYNACTYCGICENICRVGALTITRPEMPAIFGAGVQLATLKTELKLLARI
jgi:ferredoxin